MADDVTLDSMSGGSVVATDEITNRHFQKAKLTFGADGTATDVTTSNGYPVQVISIAAGDNNIGNVDIASSALPSGASTSALQTTGNTALTAIQTAVEIIDNAISGAEMQVDIVSMPTVTIQDGGGTITVDGTVAISGSVAVTGTFWQATQPVSIASAVPITDNSGSLTVDAPVGTPAFVRLSDGSAAITTLPVSLASVPSHAVTNAGTFAVQVSSIAAGTNNIGDVDVLSLPALPAGSNNIGDVDVLTLPALPTGSNVIGAVTQSGTWNVGTVTTVSAVTGITNALPAGTNAIGKLAANSGVDIGDVDVTSQPARVRTTDTISSADATDALMNGTTALVPKFAKISGAASGDNVLVAAVTSKKIRVLSLFMMSAGTVNAYIRDDAGTPINLIGDATNKLTLVSGSGFVLPHNPLGWTETTSGEGLQLNLSAAIGVAGCLSYVEV